MLWAGAGQIGMATTGTMNEVGFGVTAVKMELSGRENALPGDRSMPPETGSREFMQNLLQE